jgi:hypothetical protein
MYTLPAENYKILLNVDTRPCPARLRRGGRATPAGVGQTTKKIKQLAKKR